MTTVRAAVGDNLKKFEKSTDLTDVWAFVDLHLANAGSERAVVLMDDSGATIGELWDSALYLAHWNRRAKCRHISTSCDLTKVAKFLTKNKITDCFWQQVQVCTAKFRTQKSSEIC